MSDARRRGRVVFLAVVLRDVGYVLDVHADDAARYRRELGAAVHGVFHTSQEAADAVQLAGKRHG
jgi:hypothetical protein